MGRELPPPSIQHLAHRSNPPAGAATRRHPNLHHVQNRKDHSPATAKVTAPAPLTLSTNSRRRIAEGQFYEAHQQLRVIAARYAKQHDTAATVDVLASGARALLEAGQGGSGGDLGLALLDTYAKARVVPDAESKARVLALLRAFPQGEPTLRRFVGDMISCVDVIG